MEMEAVDPPSLNMSQYFKYAWCFHVIHLHFLPSLETKTCHSVLLSSFTHRPPSTPDLVCTSRFAVSIRKEGKVKRRRLTAITRPTTSSPNSRRPRSFAHVTSSSCYGRTSESSFPAPRTCLFTPAHHTHTHTHRSWFEQRWRSWRATSTGG